MGSSSVVSIINMLLNILQLIVVSSILISILVLRHEVHQSMPERKK